MIENKYKINFPTFNAWQTKFDVGVIVQEEVRAAINKANSSYLPWSELKYKNWIPGVFSCPEEFWYSIKFNRMVESQLTPIRDEKYRFFDMNIQRYNEFLHILDKEMAGNFMGISDFSEADKRRFINRNIIEESIASSQLEGANTSRLVAKKMLLEGRKPRNHSEQMIVNNHLTMLNIEQNLYKQELSLDLILELHAKITEGVIADDKRGRLRETLDENGNPLVIKPWDHNTVVYVTPSREFVEQELPRLIDFANDKNANEFIHPVIKAIMLHFWIGLLHPFEDGNGRLARILFYWYMLKNDYWAFAYISLSEKIKKSSKQYAMAYIYSEQDDQDLTYFIHYNIEKLKLARADFQNYTKAKVNENKLTILLAQKKNGFNERQIKLLQYFIQNREGRTTLETHLNLYGITKGTAATDLKKLADEGYLIKQKNGRNVYYYPAEKIVDLLKFS